jgi:serine/threonine protein kinase
MNKYEFNSDTKELLISGNKINFINSGYELIEEIGVGRNGIVLKGKDCTLGRTVAIKFWLPRYKNDTIPDSNKFYNEIQKLAQLNSDKIVKIYSANVIDDNYFYAVYEFVQGETLEKWLKKGQSFELRCFILEQLYYEMRNVHKMGIYHGDFHDKNILIESDFSTKIIDFGTSFFANKKEDSHKREARLLLNTGLSILKPEYEIYTLLHEDVLKKSPPECIPCSILMLSEVIREFNKLDNTPDDYTKKGAVFGIVVCVCDSPFFILDNILHLLQNSILEDAYIELFVGCVIATCNDNISSLDSCIKKIPVTSENIEIMKSIYLEWREKYVKELKTLNPIEN